MNDNASLPAFTPLPSTQMYAKLHKHLWPTPGEGNRLSHYIRTCVADLSIWTKDKDADATAMDVDQSIQIRYIDLDANEIFLFQKFVGSTALIVRQEYDDFIAKAKNGGRFFVTGQPGIGKSIGTYYILFSLLASGQSVFFVPDTTWVYYFSEVGVERIAAMENDIGNDPDVVAALKHSWALVDVDVNTEGWLPDLWTRWATTLVWTSSPRDHRMHHFCKQFIAGRWYMKPWSLGEITAMTILTNRDPSNILQRLRIIGPVARGLFAQDDTDILSAQDIDSILNKILPKNPFSWATAKLVEGIEATHRIFLVEPLELLDEVGVDKGSTSIDGEGPSVDRKRPSINFLTNYIANRTAKAMEEHVQMFRQHLSEAFDDGHTRSSAGKLVESMLHRVLIHKKIDPRPVFGVDEVTEKLELLGKADDFVLETHKPSMRTCGPLYLQPQSPTFAAVDAILITGTSVFLIQCTLGTSHSHEVPTLLHIIARLQASQIEVDSPPLGLIYCVLGTDEHRVRELLVPARTKVAALRGAVHGQPMPKELQKLPQNTHARLNRLQVQGVLFDTGNDTLTPVL